MQCYTNALKAHHDQGNPTKSNVDQVMDFFHGIDNGRYTNFKVNYINSLQVKAIEPPMNLNEMFALANSWLKEKLLSGGGYGSTFATKADKVNKKDQNGKGSSSKQAIQHGKKPGRRGKQGRRKLKCFICGDEYYATSCPHHKKVVTEVTKDSEDDKDEQQVNITFEANILHINPSQWNIKGSRIPSFCSKIKLISQLYDHVS